MTIALDLAASEFYDHTTQTYIEKKKKGQNRCFPQLAEEQIDYLEDLCSKYPDRFDRRRPRSKRLERMEDRSLPA